MRLNITISDSWFTRDSVSLSFNLYIGKEDHICNNPSKANNLQGSLSMNLQNNISYMRTMGRILKQTHKKNLP